LWITNDTLAPLRDVATVELARLAGGAEWRERVTLDVSANRSDCVWRGTVADAADCILTVRSAAGGFPANRLLLAAVKDLALDPDPGLSLSFAEADDGQHVTVTAERYALAVRLRSDDPALRFSDSHFDLAGGERRTVIVTHREGKAIDRDAIEVSCWNQAGT
jgi:beta-mannosidase